MYITLTALVTNFFGIPLVSMEEWGLHRYVMHQTLWILHYPKKRHADVHHAIFKSDDSYHLSNHKKLEQKNDREKVSMAWWNWLVLVPIGTIPFCIPAIVLAHFGWWAEAWTTLICGAIDVLAYYCAYEALHWCMHVPENRPLWLERSRMFKWLDAHHRLHHFTDGNYNVFLPIWDWIFRTLQRQRAIPVVA